MPRRDDLQSILLFLQAPVLGLLIFAVTGSNRLSGGSTGPENRAGTVLIAMVLAATYLGAANSIREVVKELSSEAPRK